MSKKKKNLHALGHLYIILSKIDTYYKENKNEANL